MPTECQNLTKVVRKYNNTRNRHSSARATCPKHRPRGGAVGERNGANERAEEYGSARNFSYLSGLLATAALIIHEACALQEGEEEEKSEEGTCKVGPDPVVVVVQEAVQRARDLLRAHAVGAVARQRELLALEQLVAPAQQTHKAQDLLVLLGCSSDRYRV